MRLLGLLALLLLVGCGPPAGETCTAIGALTGVYVEVAPGTLPEGAQRATLEACWDGSCRERSVTLDRDMAGRVPIPSLPTKPVELTLAVTGAGGRELIRDTITVTPELVYPNGRHCDPAGPQVSLTLDSHGLTRSQKGAG